MPSTVYIVSDGIQTGEYIFANDIFMLNFSQPSIDVAERMASEFADDLAGMLSQQTNESIEVKTIYLTAEDREKLPHNYSGEDIGRLLVEQNRIEASLFNKVFSLTKGDMTVRVKDSPIDSETHRIAFNVINYCQSEVEGYGEGWAGLSLPQSAFMKDFTENKALTRQLIHQSIDEFLADQNDNGPRQRN